MFKRAVFTDEVSQDFAKAVEVAQEYDLDGLEIRSVWDKPPQDIDSADIDRMKQIMSGTDLVVWHANCRDTDGLELFISTVIR